MAFYSPPTPKDREKENEWANLYAKKPLKDEYVKIVKDGTYWSGRPQVFFMPRKLHNEMRKGDKKSSDWELYQRAQQDNQSKVGQKLTNV
jgi:hypothetical protein